MTAREELDRALERAARAGLRIPCADRADEFTADDVDVLERAAEECVDCPVPTECAAASEGETWGAWAGVVLWPSHAKRPTTSRRGGRPAKETA